MRAAFRWVLCAQAIDARPPPRASSTARSTTAGKRTESIAIGPIALTIDQAGIALGESQELVLDQRVKRRPGDHRSARRDSRSRVALEAGTRSPTGESAVERTRQRSRPGALRSAAREAPPQGRAWMPRALCARHPVNNCRRQQLRSGQKLYSIGNSRTKSRVELPVQKARYIRWEKIQSDT